MSDYEADPAGLGVGKRYGPLAVGGVAGKIGGVDASQQCQFMLAAGEDEGLNAMAQQLPAYARITKIELNKIAAYAASSTVDVQLDGTSVLATATPIAITGTGYSELSLHATVANLLVGSSAEDLKVVINANGLASTTGEAIVTVTYTTA